MQARRRREQSDNRLERLTSSFLRGAWLTVVVAVGLPVLIAPFSGTASQPAPIQRPAVVVQPAPAQQSVAPVPGDVANANAKRHRAARVRAERGAR